MAGKGGAQRRGVPRPERDDLPFGHLAARIWDELYDTERNWTLRELANKTGKKVSYTHIRNIFQGEPWKWDAGKPLIEALGGNAAIWEERWREAFLKEQERRRYGGVEPLPWIDEDDPDIPVAERAVGDWSMRRLPNPHRWIRPALFSAAVLVTIASAIWFGIRIGALVAAMSLMAALGWSSKRHRRVRDAVWQRQIVLKAVRAHARDIQRYTRIGRFPPNFRLVGRQRRDQPNIAADFGQRTLRQLFDDASDCVLLVSNPGLGKSFQLAKLAQDLTEEQLARLDARPSELEGPVDAWWEIQPLPILLHLATYRGQPLDEWVVSAINVQYGYATKLARLLLHKPGVLLLLDGLDEVPELHRRECVNQLRTWRRQARGLAVTCRMRDYNLARKIRAGLEVEIVQPTRPQVQECLRSHSAALADVRAALEEDKSLWQLFSSPLMLNIIYYAYAGRSAAELLEPGTVSQRCGRLFDAYLRRMLNHRPSRYDDSNTIAWLNWLARTLTARGESVLYLDRLDITWAPITKVKLAKVLPKYVVQYALAIMTLAWLAIIAEAGFARVNFGNAALLIVAMVAITVMAFRAIPTSSQGSGHSAGIAIPALALVSGQVESANNPVFLIGTVTLWGMVTATEGMLITSLQPVEQLRWTWVPRIRVSFPGGSKPTTLYAAYAVGSDILAAGVVISAIGVVIPQHVSIRLLLPAVLAIITLYTVSGQFQPSLLDQRPRPNEGIRRSARFAFVHGSLTAIAAGSLVAMATMKLLGHVTSPSRAWLVGALCGVLLGLVRGFRLGGVACVHYWTIRTLLSRHQYAPVRYQTFLRDAEARVLLHRIGSGFAFPHRLIQEHLAISIEELTQRLELASPTPERRP